MVVVLGGRAMHAMPPMPRGMHGGYLSGPSPLPLHSSLPFPPLWAPPLGVLECNSQVPPLFFMVSGGVGVGRLGSKCGGLDLARSKWGEARGL